MYDTSIKNNKNKEVKKRKKNNEKINEKVITIDKKQIELENKKSNLLLIFVGIFFLIVLVLMSNKTFFKKVYNNDTININIPVFLYYINDKDNTITFKTLRKSEYIKEYFDEYLSNLDNYDYYMCDNGKSVYYDEKTNIVIYNIQVKKNIALKTIKIKYDIKEPGKVCE